MEHLVMMLPTMMASRRVQVPDSHSGMRIPEEGQRGSHFELRVRERMQSRKHPHLPQSQPSPKSYLLLSPAGAPAPPYLTASWVLTFKPGSRLEKGLLECHVEVEIESFVFSNIISYPGEQNKIVEALGHAFLQVR